uniref:Solute carrier family 13 member 3 n=1 Tax=Sinocyclocheilus rhinocerous TaxID=307959 RepID=A0A673JSE1_9TELE
MDPAKFSRKLWSARKQLILMLAPLLLLPLLFIVPPKEGKCLYVVLLMAVYWCTEALPLAVTAMLPVCLFPTMGILPSKKVCPQYFLETNFLFLSGLVMASAIEEWGLHRRIALKVLKIVGVKPAWLILGMMITSSFLSMWLSNTATTAMMLPIANAILESLFGNLETLKENCKDKSDPEEVRREAEYQMKVWKGFLISIPYAASIGGTATLTGTAPNLILVGQLKSYFPECDLINFGSWFVFAFPLMLLFLILGWIWIAFLYGGLNTRLCISKHDERAAAEAKAKAVIDEDYKKLGPIKFAEGSITFLFIIFAVLLFTRDPKFVTGWSVFFTKGKAQESVPWNIILLLGGGFAMAKGCEESGLAVWIGNHLQPLAQVPPAVAVILITAFIACFTEFASNTATIIIFLPVIAELAIRVNVNPLYFMIPATTGCSYAFMLPVSTPPNSIAFASGHLMVKDMVKTGFVMNILGILCVSLAMNTWGLHMFNLHIYPEWARPLNASSATVATHAIVTMNMTG